MLQNLVHLWVFSLPVLYIYIYIICISAKLLFQPLSQRQPRLTYRWWPLTQINHAKAIWIRAMEICHCMSPGQRKDPGKTQHEQTAQNAQVCTLWMLSNLDLNPLDASISTPEVLFKIHFRYPFGQSHGENNRGIIEFALTDTRYQVGEYWHWMSGMGMSPW